MDFSILDEPPQIRHAFTEKTLKPGPSVFLKCTASGNPTPEVTWELDGKILTNNDRYEFEKYKNRKRKISLNW